MTDLGNAEARLRGLCDGEQRLLGFAPTSTTDEGVYYITIRAWPHPELDDATTVSLRYAYLTRGAGSDGWIDGDAAGINLRVEGDPAEFLGGLAQLVAAAKPRVDGGSRPALKDLRPEE